MPSASQLVADVPVGCFLSGGIDSSLLVALAKPHLPALRSFTIGFEEAASDERGYARAFVEALCGTPLRERRRIRCDLAPNACRDAGVLRRAFRPDRADPVSSRSPGWRAKTARSSRSAVTAPTNCLPATCATTISTARPGFRRPPDRLWGWLRRRGLAGAAPADARRPGALFPLRRLPRRGRNPGNPDRFRTGSLEDSHEAVMQRFFRPDLPALAAAQYLDANLFMVDQVLCKVNRASMAHGVEVRVPFLDPRVVDSLSGFRRRSITGMANAKRC